MFRRGFSLFELAMSLAIIAVIAAIAAPRYTNSLARYRAELTAKRLAADLKYAQSHAKTASQTVTVQFDSAGGWYRVTGAPHPHSRSGTMFQVHVGADPYRASLAASSFEGSSTFSLDGYGLPSAPGKIQIQAGSASKAIVVNADGAITIQ